MRRIRFLLPLALVLTALPQAVFAQDLSVSPPDIFQGECYSVQTSMPYLTLDVVYYFESQGPYEIPNWVSLDSNGYGIVCTDYWMPPGAYGFVYARESGTQYYFPIDAALTVWPAGPAFPQPTSLTFSSASGHAGNAGYIMTVGNGGGMTIEADYTLDGIPQNPWSVTLDPNGQWAYSINHYDRVGTYRLLRIRNVLNSEWVEIDGSYTVLPPQPAGITVSPGQGAAGSGYWNLTVPNGAEMALDMRYTLNGVPLPDISGWPWLEALSPGNPDGGAFSIPINVCSAPGLYRFTHLRNHLNGAESDWVPVSGANTLAVTPPPAPTVASVTPAGGYTGTTISVNLQGTNLCGVSLSSNYPGLSFLPVAANPDSDGTSVIAQFAIAPGALPGAATVNLAAHGGTTSFTFHVGGVPAPVVLSKEYIYLGERLLAVESP
jgi:hypothetical protein